MLNLDLPKESYPFRYERNLVILNLLLATRTTKRTEWKRNYSLYDLLNLTSPADVNKEIKEANIQAIVRCHAGPKQVVPHGVDNEIMYGLLNLYCLSGMPESGQVSCTVRQFLDYAGLSQGGKSRRTLVESLQRLQGATYEIESGWYDKSREKYRWRVEQLSLLSRFWLEDTTLFEVIGQLQSGTIVNIEISSMLTDSIRAGYTRLLNPKTYKELDNTLARSLYRLLAEISETNPPDNKIVVGLDDWCHLLGVNGRRDNILPRLKKGHETLLERGLLKTAEITGRGGAVRVHYTLSETLKNEQIDPRLLVELMQRGISSAKAKELLHSCSTQSIETGIKTYERCRQHMIAAGQTVKSESGLLIDVLKHPGKYDGWATPPTANEKRSPQKKKEPTPTPELTESGRREAAAYAIKSYDLTTDEGVSALLIEACGRGDIAISDLSNFKGLEDSDIIAKINA